jgi:hypothetical protein
MIKLLFLLNRLPSKQRSLRRSLRHGLRMSVRQVPTLLLALCVPEDLPMQSMRLSTILEWLTYTDRQSNRREDDKQIRKWQTYKLIRKQQTDKHFPCIVRIRRSANAMNASIHHPRVANINIQTSRQTDKKTTNRQTDKHFPCAYPKICQCNQCFYPPSSSG